MQDTVDQAHGAVPRTLAGMPGGEESPDSRGLGVSPDLGLCRGAGDGNRTRTISLGTGLSCHSDPARCRSAAIFDCP